MTAINKNWLLILISASVLVTISFGVRQTMGLFLDPISFELGTGREVFSFAVALQNLLWGASAPLFGMLAERIGTWKTVSLGGIIYTAGLAAMAGIVTPAGMIFGNVLIGLGLGSAGISIALGAVSNSVPEEKRSLAFGIVTSLGSFGQFALLWITQPLIAGYGWQTAMVILSCIAASMIAIGLGFRGDRDTTPAANIPDDAASGEAGLGRAIRHAFGSRDYLLLTAGFFVCGLHLVFITTHLPVYLADNGVDRSIAAKALSLVGLFNIAGALFFGWIGGVTGKKIPLAMIYLARTVVIALFITLPVTPLSALLFGAAMGFVWLGTIPLTSGLVATFFGPRHLATLYGFVFLSHQLGSFMGAWLGGRLYDIFDDYNLMWGVNLGAGLLAVGLHLAIREKPVPLPEPAKA